MERATRKQIGFIAGLSAKLGLGSHARNGIREVLGAEPPAGLSKQQAGIVIRTLQQRLQK